MVSTAETAHRYRVRVGHMEVFVVAQNETEAIDLARRAFAQELPRFYDLIRALESSRFELQKAA
ncbi:MAG: hypothetical protein SH868_02855 [Bythopirellula sp.]|nr:hypothetical protein [Bythopirellula sp.]